jgi:hypothetical protein
MKKEGDVCLKRTYVQGKTHKSPTAKRLAGSVEFGTRVVQDRGARGTRRQGAGPLGGEAALGDEVPSTINFLGFIKQ